MPATPPVLLDPTQIAERLRADLPSWRHADGAIERVYRTSGWKSTALAVGAIAHLAEAAWHHPELVVSHGKLAVKLTTHDAGGVTEKDLALAAMLDRVILWHPDAATGPLTGPPADAPHMRRP